MALDHYIDNFHDQVHIIYITHPVVWLWEVTVHVVVVVYVLIMYILSILPTLWYGCGR